MGRKRLYREYDKETGELIKLECGKCREIKDVSCFNKDKSKKDGVQTKCKQCDNERCRQWRESNPDYVHQYYENHREEILEYKYQWRESNPDYNRQWNESHREERHEYRCQWYGNKTQQEMIKIYENVTKQRYPNNGIQYGIIYGVQNLITNRWYIGQTTIGFNTRYHGDFFNYKYNELSEDGIKGKLLVDDIEKYGQENFEIIEVLDVAFSEKELDEKEAYYIDLYKAYDEGYNSTRGNIFKHDKEKRMCCCE